MATHPPTPAAPFASTDPLDPLSAEHRARLETFLDLVLVWTQRIDLIAPLPRDRAWQRHVVDSLQLVPLVPESATELADLGSGGGFPGMVLAIVRGLPTHLVESDHRKAAFLREAARATQAEVEVHAVRAEDLRPLDSAVVTARALAPLERLLPLVRRHLALQGTAILPKGAGWRAELARLSPRAAAAFEPIPSRTDPDAMILVARHGLDG